MKYATAFAQAICSLLPCMLSSLHSIPTASSSSSPSAARLSSYRLDLQVPEHLRISVEPPIWLPYTSSVTLPGRLALSSFVNTFTPVPAISSIRPNHFPTCFRANCSQKKHLLLVQDMLPSCIFLTKQIYCWPTSTWGKTNHKHFWMANWWYLLSNASWLKCWTCLHGQKHFRFIKWFCVIIILAGGRIYCAINCSSFRQVVMHDLTITWPSAMMWQHQALLTDQK